jgi:hypothetical protein
MTKFLKHLSEQYKSSPSTFVMALVYIDRYLNAVGLSLSLMGGFDFHRLFIVAFIVASKMNEDYYIGNESFSTVLKTLQVTEINSLER